MLAPDVGNQGKEYLDTYTNLLKLKRRTAKIAKDAEKYGTEAFRKRKNRYR